MIFSIFIILIEQYEYLFDLFYVNLLINQCSKSKYTIKTNGSREIEKIVC